MDDSIEKHEIEMVWRGNSGNLKGSNLVLKWRDEMDMANRNGDVFKQVVKEDLPAACWQLFKRTVGECEAHLLKVGGE